MNETSKFGGYILFVWVLHTTYPTTMTTNRQNNNNNDETNKATIKHFSRAMKMNK